MYVDPSYSDADELIGVVEAPFACLPRCAVLERAIFCVFAPHIRHFLFRCFSGCYFVVVAIYVENYYYSYKYSDTYEMPKTSEQTNEQAKA